MQILKDLQFPDVKLKKIATPVEKIDYLVKKTAQNMLATMYYYQGIGLAASQIGLNKRIIVIDITKNFS